MDEIETPSERLLLLIMTLLEDCEELTGHIRRQIENYERDERDESLARALEGLTALACGLAAAGG